MPDQTISLDDAILALDDSMYLPIVDPTEPDAADQNKRVLASLLKTVFATLANDNTFTGVNTFSSSVRFATEEVTNDTESENITKNAVVVTNGSLSGFNVDLVLPASPSNGDWHMIKNASDDACTVNAGSYVIYTESTQVTITMFPGDSAILVYRGGVWASMIHRVNTVASIDENNDATLSGIADVYYLDGSNSSVALPSYRAKQVFTVVNESTSVSITLTGSIRAYGSNFSSVKLRPGTIAEFHGRDSRWNRIR